MTEGKRFTSGGLAMLLFAALASTPAVRAAPGAAAEPSPEFRQLDANRDGYISPAEVKKLRGFEKAFREADDNRDSRLDASEFVKAQAIYERMRVEQYVGDSVITAKVKAALLKDAQVSGLDVKVETYEGKVLLSGFVNNEQQVQRAAEIASGVRGVVAVKNSLVVKS